MGADVSGHAGHQWHAKHIGFVLGTRKDIDRAHQRLGFGRVHMSRMRENKRVKIIARARFDCDVLGICVHVEKQKAIDGVLRHRAFGTKPKHAARNHFNHLLWRYVRDDIMDFASKHRCEVRDIEVECDSDMRDTVLAWGMKPAAGAKAYDLADVIAWSNVHDRAINTCKELDIHDKIYRDMRSDLLK